MLLIDSGAFVFSEIVCFYLLNYPIDVTQVDGGADYEVHEVLKRRK